ncbi:MAG: MltA domain-containing protein [Phycisphaerales bacterium]|jgi:membrane-bound lytic murein transglycosylase A|nr:MltA domain-containing protein [Phycisphaerales bacterium]
MTPRSSVTLGIALIAVLLLSPFIGCAASPSGTAGTAKHNTRIDEAITTAIPVLERSNPIAAERWREWLERPPSDRSIHGADARPMSLRSIPGVFKATAYAAPILDARRTRDTTHRHAILGDPIHITDAASLPTRREVAGNQVTPVPVLGWVADGLDAYLAEVNGSTALRFPDGTVECLAWSRTNERPYTSLGRRLVETGLANPDTIDLDVIRTLHQTDPETVERLMLDNDRLVFFEIIPTDRWPRASTGVRLIPRHSVAVDPEVIPLGSVVMIEDLGGASVVAVAVDIGGAIKGRRIDVYLGAGDVALAEAGRLIESVRISIIEPTLDH